VLLQGIEVLGQQRARPPLVGTGRIGEPPPGGLQVGAQTAEHADRPADHAGRDSAVRQLGQVRQVGQLADHQPHRLVHVLSRQ
jgi:hypothetical protein